MKTLQGMVMLVLVLSMLAVPAFAQGSEIGNRVGSDGMSPELWEIVYGRDGFSGFRAGASEVELVGMSVDQVGGLSLSVWNTIYGRDGYDFYASTERSRQVVRGMPLELRNFISGRDGFDLYAATRLTVGSSDLLAAKPDAVPAALWQIISGRDGFGSANVCEVC